MDRAAIERAVAVGRQDDEAALARFHAAYCVDVAEPPFERIEIVTEFRRVVLAAEERRRVGDRAWGGAHAAAMAAPHRGHLALVLHLALSPHNLYVDVPEATLVLYDRQRNGASLDPIDVRRVPRSIIGHPVSPGGPFQRATIETVFDARRLDPGATYLVGIVWNGREVRRVPVAFGSVR